MGPKMGFPRWFPTALGLWKLAFVYANWADDGAHAPLAQAMMAFHTGGATHVQHDRAVLLPCLDPPPPRRPDTRLSASRPAVHRCPSAGPAGARAWPVARRVGMATRAAACSC